MLDIIVALCVINAVLTVLCAFMIFMWSENHKQKHIDKLHEIVEMQRLQILDAVLAASTQDIINLELIAEARAARSAYARHVTTDSTEAEATS